MADEQGPRQPNILECLEGHLKAIDALHDAQVSVDPDPGYVDLAASLTVTALLLDLLHDLGMDSAVLARLHGGLAEIQAGSSPAAMFRSRAPAKKPPARMSVEMLRGGLAGVMELRMMKKRNLKEAGQWVINHMSTETKRHAAEDPATFTWITVSNWREDFGSVRRSGIGRDNYVRIVETGKRVAAGRPGPLGGDPALRMLRIIESQIVRRLPTPANKTP